MHLPAAVDRAALPLILAAPPFSALHDAAAAQRHVVVDAPCGGSTLPPGFQRPSLRTMQRGAELLRLGARRLRLDQDAWLATNAGADRDSRYEPDGGSTLVVVFARDALTQAVHAPDIVPEPPRPDHAGSRFLETLQPIAGAVGRHLRAISRAARTPVADALWWDERMALLLDAALDAEASLHGRAVALGAQKATTRRELLRRVLIASDHIQSHYDRPLTLREIATAAHLSAFHLVRLFRQVHGITPHAYLTRKRLQVALRLLDGTRWPLDEIAARTGLGTRSSLFRHLRRQQGSGAAAWRARDGAPMEIEPCSTCA